MTSFFSFREPDLVFLCLGCSGGHSTRALLWSQVSLRVPTAEHGDQGVTGGAARQTLSASMTPLGPWKESWEDMVLPEGGRYEEDPYHI